MNKEGHLIWSQIVLIITMGLLLLFTLQELALAELLTGLTLSIVTFLFGVVLPDWDHHAVQKKIIFIRWLGRITSHRGHWHSLIAMLVYGAVIYLILFPFQIEYNLWIVGAGMMGFLSHLVEDQIMKVIKRSQARNALKIW